MTIDDLDKTGPGEEEKTPEALQGSTSITEAVGQLKDEVTRLIEGGDELPEQDIAVLLAEHPSMLSELALWNVIRGKWQDANADYLAFLRKLKNGELSAGIEPQALERLKLESAVRLGDQLRRRTGDEREEGVAMLEEVVSEIDPETTELWEQRLLGTGYYNLATATVKAPIDVELDYDTAREYYGSAIQYSQAAGHTSGVLQSKEAQAYWVEAQSGNVSGAKTTLRSVVEEVTKMLATVDPADTLTEAELRNTQANAAINFAQAGKGMTKQDAAKAAIAEFPEVADNAILQRLAQ